MTKKKPDETFEAATRQIAAAFRKLTPLKRVRLLREIERRLKGKPKKAPIAEQAKLFE